MYEGRQIYFGESSRAKEYFQNLGFEPLSRQNTADFLTSLTSPDERQGLIRPGFEKMVPRTAEEFEAVWAKSELFSQLMQDIEEYNTSHPFNGRDLDRFKLLSSNKTRADR